MHILFLQIPVTEKKRYVILEVEANLQILLRSIFVSRVVITLGNETKCLCAEFN